MLCSCPAPVNVWQNKKHSFHWPYKSATSSHSMIKNIVRHFETQSQHLAGRLTHLESNWLLQCQWPNHWWRLWVWVWHFKHWLETCLLYCFANVGGGAGKVVCFRCESPTTKNRTQWNFWRRTSRLQIQVEYWRGLSCAAVSSCLSHCITSPSCSSTCFITLVNNTPSSKDLV